jgi:hypothetical protein
MVWMHPAKRTMPHISTLNRYDLFSNTQFVDILFQTTGATIDAIRRMQINIGMIKGNNLRYAPTRMFSIKFILPVFAYFQVVTTKIYKYWSKNFSVIYPTFVIVF